MIFDENKAHTTFKEILCVTLQLFFQTSEKILILFY